VIAELITAFGVRGEIKIRPYVDDLAILTGFKNVLLKRPDGKSVTTRFLQVRAQQKNVALACVEGITERDEAEKWRNAVFLVAREDMPPLPEGAYYDWELIGLEVVTEAGASLGKIEAVHRYPANDVYETPLALIPAVEAFVLRVDSENGQMTVRDMPGLRKAD
jgi:16S rRNA processing protein RimM